jgi:DNA repair protein RadC
MTATLSLFSSDEVPVPLPTWCFVRLVREPGTATRPAVRIRTPGDVHRLLAPRVQPLDQEAFYVIALGSQSDVRAVHEVTRGLLNSSLVHPREVFRAAILAGAAGIILVHNHPSGDPTPSADDRAVTRQMVDAGRLLDVPVYDHVILAGDRYVSFAEAGLL